MPVSSIFRALSGPSHPTQDDVDQPYKANTSSLPTRIHSILSRTWDLGFTAFGGPPVHFRIFHQRFVEGLSARSSSIQKHAPWLDEQTYQELFAVCSALPGPGSTKLGFCIAQVHAGMVPALIQFLVWAGPGAAGMYALALGIKNIDEVLPKVVYGLLSGLNSSTVGIIALAAVQLAEKAITDQTSRVLVVFGACAGLCYTALWYFPVLMVIGALTTLGWDCWARGVVGRYRERRKRRKEEEEDAETAASRDRRRGSATGDPIGVEMQDIAPKATAAPPLPGPGEGSSSGVQHRRPVFTNLGEDIQRDVERQEATGPMRDPSSVEPIMQPTDASSTDNQPGWTRHESTDMLAHAIPVKAGIAIIVTFFASFIAVLVLRGVLASPPLELNLFANMYLAGTIIFGGGPVVIPLLRSYVVDPGWVSPRNFLIGLAIIQAFPGPNFNFAVFLGALTLSSTFASSLLGAVIAFIGIFAPGMILAVGVQSLWRVLRSKPTVVATLRGVNAAAVGLVFTAVYRLWEIGWLTEESTSGRSLGGDPWWVVVAAATFCGVRWLAVPAPVGIILGGVAGVAWWWVVQA